MPQPGPQQLPLLTVADFGPGLDHVAETYQAGKVFAIVHETDQARLALPSLTFPPHDPYTYVFIHGGGMQADSRTWIRQRTKSR